MMCDYNTGGNCLIFYLTTLELLNVIINVIFWFVILQ